MSTKPRSLVLDVCGEYLRYVAGDVRQQQFTALLGDFGVAAATVRVTIARLRDEGWFTSRRVGRETVFRLTDHMTSVLDEGRARIFAAPARAWERQWTMVIYQLSEAERTERNQLRKALAWHGFGPLGTSTWIAPGDRRLEARALVDEMATDQVDILLCQSEGPHNDREMAARCWDMQTLNKEYDRFIQSHEVLAAAADRLTGRDALHARTELIHAFRHFPFLDPRLPEELRPDPWLGEDAHLLFRRAYDALGPAARAHVGDLIGAEVPAPPEPEPLSVLSRPAG
ncbi:MULTISPECIES: PaaX family transcriptional regulator C-terminal domain-containing protein [unclassified Aeromicrobium]|uniref:PaaX family transcriptional regulator n=1 Tax=unclassified Aeromicrobium TaxID=2633570 RepID=UPI00396AFBB0